MIRLVQFRRGLKRQTQLHGLDPVSRGFLRQEVIGLSLGAWMKEGSGEAGTLTAPGLCNTGGEEAGCRILRYLMVVHHSLQQSNIGSVPRPVRVQLSCLEGCEGETHRASHRGPQSPGDTPRGVGTEQVSHK